VSAQHARQYLEAEIKRHRALEQKLMDWSVWGTLPRPRRYVEPGPAEKAAAASKAGDVAAERMRLEHALGELER